MNKYKLQKLIQDEGFEHEIDFIEDYINESIVPGICTNKDCDEIYSYEPDQDKGYCEECHTNTVKSAFILANII